MLKKHVTTPERSWYVRITSSKTFYICQINKYHNKIENLITKHPVQGVRKYSFYVPFVFAGIPRWKIIKAQITFTGKPRKENQTWEFPRKGGCLISSRKSPLLFGMPKEKNNKGAKHVYRRIIIRREALLQEKIITVCITITGE